MGKGFSASIAVIIGLLLVLLAVLVFMGARKENLSVVKSDSKSNLDFNKELKGYSQFADKCMELQAKKAIDFYGYDLSKIKGYIANTFSSCLNGFKGNLNVTYDLAKLSVDLNETSEMLAFFVKLPVMVRSGDHMAGISSFSYSFKKVKLERLDKGMATKDINLISSDDKASIVLSTGTALKKEDVPVVLASIKTEAKPKVSFLEGNFIYEASPSGARLDKPFVVEIKYDDTMIDEKKDLAIAYSSAPNEWKALPTIKNTKANTLVALTDVFSAFGISEATSTVPVSEEKDGIVYLGKADNGGKKSEDHTSVLKKNDAAKQEQGSEIKSDYPGMNTAYLEQTLSSQSSVQSVSGTVDGAQTIALSNVPKGSVASVSGDVAVSEQKMGDTTYLTVQGRGEFTIDYIKECDSDSPFLGMPFVLESKYRSDILSYNKQTKVSGQTPLYSQGISYCFGDPLYISGATDYIHAGTDFVIEHVPVVAACDGSVVDAFNAPLNLGGCNVGSLNQKYIIGTIYQKVIPRQPYESYPETMAEKLPYDGAVTNPGNAIVLECAKSIGGKSIQLLYFHLEPQIDVCIGEEVVKGTVIGISDNSGDSKGGHLHLELRICEESEKVEGVCPRVRSINPALLPDTCLSGDLVALLDASMCYTDVLSHSVLEIDESYFTGTG
ncbi:MAG: M23 family metallopeptidase [Candidatus Woesearchaeota archaeon]|nr:M23 family metallopeptidase [Candidatus Woesearchaeota archaeon]